MNKKSFCFLVLMSFFSQEDYSSENFDFHYSEKVRATVPMAEIQHDVRESLEDIQKCLESLPIVRSEQKCLCLENSAICEALSDVRDINDHLIDMVFREGIEKINELKNSDEIKRLSELTLRLCVALDAEEKYQQERGSLPFSVQETVLLQTIDGDIVQSCQEVQVEELNPYQQISFSEDIKEMSIIHEKFENLQIYIENITLLKEPSLCENMFKFWKTLF